MINSQNNWKKRIILFLISQSITLFGSQLVQMAIIWYVTLHTSSGAWIAAFTVCSYLPQFLLSFIGGVWADRYNRKRLIILADAGIAAVTFVMIILIPHIEAEKILLIVLLFISIIRSMGAGIQSPAVNAVIPQLVPQEYLMRYNGINSIMQSVVQFEAPAAAGVILTISTLRSTLMIDILTAIMGISIFSCVLLPKKENANTPASIFLDINIGIHYVFIRNLIRKVLVLYGIFTFLCVPAGYLSGLLVSRVYGNTYWYLTAVEVVGFGGMMIGGLLMSVWGGFKSRNKTLAIGLVAFGTMAISMGLSKNFILYLILMALYGVSLTVIHTTITTLLQEKTELTMQGRVFGLMSSMYSLCYPIGMAVFGPMADIIPLQIIMISSGIALIMIAFIARTDKSMHSI